MNFNWKHSAGALALSVAMLSMSATAQVAAPAKRVKPPAEVVQPAPSVDIETGQLLIKIPIPPNPHNTSDTPPPVDDAVAPGSTERGIKDNGVKGCTGCGITGKEAAPPPVDDAAAPPSGDIVHGPNGGMIIDKGKPNLPTAAKKKKSRPRVLDLQPNARSSLLPVLGGLVGIAALALAVGSGGDDNPTSP